MEPITVLYLSLLGLVVYLYVNRSRRGLPLPPGPKKLPIIGNALDIPAVLAEQVYHRYCKEFDTDIIHLEAAGQSIVILDSFEATMDLLEKRSATYSSRPRFPMLNELMGWDWNLILQPYGDAWRARRKLFQQTFQENAVKTFRPAVLKATHQLVVQLSDAPDGFMTHVSHFAAKIVMSVAYGIDVKPDDIYVELVDRANASLIKVVAPGAYLVDALPFLKYVPSWFPGAQFKRDAKRWKELCLASVDVPFKAAKKLIEDGAAQPSFTSLSLADVVDEKERASREKMIAEVASAMYGAGTDTTSAVITTFIMAMMLHPEVQKVAQQEIDSVVQKGHLPSWDDEEQLPFVTAVLLEVLRWSPVAPVGLPHRLQAEDTYKGYSLPNGSLIIANIWAMSRDEEHYPDPEKFNPYRFLTKDGKINKKVRDPRDIVFGFGRRICPGRHMAQASLWIVFATLFATLDICRPEDPNAAEPVIDDTSIFRRPKPFKCSLKPRSKEIEDLVRSELWSE